MTTTIYLYALEGNGLESTKHEDCAMVPGRTCLPSNGEGTPKNSGAVFSWSVAAATVAICLCVCVRACVHACVPRKAAKQGDVTAKLAVGRLTNNRTLLAEAKVDYDTTEFSKPQD